MGGLERSFGRDDIWAEAWIMRRVSHMKMGRVFHAEETARTEVQDGNEFGWFEEQIKGWNLVRSGTRCG